MSGWRRHYNLSVESGMDSYVISCPTVILSVACLFSKACKRILIYSSTEKAGSEVFMFLFRGSQWGLYLLQGC